MELSTLLSILLNLRQTSFVFFSSVVISVFIYLFLSNIIADFCASFASSHSPLFNIPARSCWVCSALKNSRTHLRGHEDLYFFFVFCFFFLVFLINFSLISYLSPFNYFSSVLLIQNNYPSLTVFFILVYHFLTKSSQVLYPYSYLSLPLGNLNTVFKYCYRFICLEK